MASKGKCLASRLPARKYVRLLMLTASFFGRYWGLKSCFHAIVMSEPVSRRGCEDVGGLTKAMEDFFQSPNLSCMWFLLQFRLTDRTLARKLDYTTDRETKCTEDEKLKHPLLDYIECCACVY